MNENIAKLDHHEQRELCNTRPSYRQGRKLTAVKVYTVSDESTHLLVGRVPAIQLHAELSALCSRFGTITRCVLVPGYDSGEEFVETYHVQYARLQAARFAKRQLDGRSFFGGVLHVCYAPELETTQETRSKLTLRRKEVATRVKKRASTNGSNNSTGIGIDNSSAAQPQKMEISSSLMDVSVPPPQQGSSQSFYQLQHSRDTHQASTSQSFLNLPPQNSLNLPPQNSLNLPPQTSLNSLPQTPFPLLQPVFNQPPPEGTYNSPLSQNHQNLPSQTSFSNPTSLTSLHKPPSKSLLRLVPRQVSIPKRIVFHKKPK